MFFNNFNELCIYVRMNNCSDILRSVLQYQLEEHELEIYISENIEEMKKSLNIATEGKYNFRLADRICEQIVDIKENLNKYEFLNNYLLCDDLSKNVLYNLLAYRITYLNKYLIDAFCNNVQQYFDISITIYQENCVYADCGGLDGKTVAEFIMKCPSYQKIYLYEPIPCYYEDCLKNIGVLNTDNIIVRNMAVFNDNTILKFDIGRSSGSSRVDDNGDIQVFATRLDDDIKEPLGFIKMDIEGSEQVALRGAENQIKVNTPMLAICVYHLPEDLWKIPEMIYDMNKDYDFYLRHHSIMSTDETVIYAVPKNNNGKLQSKSINLPLQVEASCLRLIKKLEATEKGNLQSSIGYLLKQLDNYKKAVKEQNKVINELKQWAEQLDEVKKYNLGQIEAHKVELKDHKDTINELRNWTVQLEEGKEYLLSQIKNRDDDLNQCKNIIDELRDSVSGMENDVKRVTFKLNEEINKTWHKKLREQIKGK